MRSLLGGRRPAMAAPSSSHRPISSASCLDPHRFVDALLGAAEQSRSERSPCSETPWSMSLDRDAFLRPDEKGRTLREHHAALSVIENLDELWFFDNVIKLPRHNHNCSSDVSPSLPAFKSIELVNPDFFATDLSEKGYKEFPRACFYFREVISGLKPSENTDGEPVPVCSSEQLLATESEISCSDLMVEAIDPEFVKEVKQAETKLEANPSSVKDWLDTTTLTVPKLGAVEQRKKVPIPLAPNNTNVGLSRKARRRKERKKKPRGTDHFEHDEMKGFKELGFSFSQDKLTPRVISLFPGVKFDYGEGKSYSRVSCIASPQYKLYESSAWCARKPNLPLYNWQFPDPHQEGVDMKAHLKFWAHAVASTIRQEC